MEPFPLCRRVCSVLHHEDQHFCWNATDCKTSEKWGASKKSTEPTWAAVKHLPVKGRTRLFTRLTTGADQNMNERPEDQHNIRRGNSRVSEQTNIIGVYSDPGVDLSSEQQLRLGTRQRETEVDNLLLSPFHVLIHSETHRLCKRNGLHTEFDDGWQMRRKHTENNQPLNHSLYLKVDSQWSTCLRHTRVSRSV